MLGVALAIGLAACGSDDDGEEATGATQAADAPVTAGSVADGAFEGQSLVWATTGGLYQDAQEEAFLDPFAEQSGAEVVADPNGTDVSKLQAMVESDNVTWDVTTTLDYAAIAQCGTLYQKIDPKLVDQSQLMPSLVSPCGVPTDINPTLLVYNEELFGDDPPTALEDFFDVDAYPGKRAVLAIPGFPDPTLIEMALLADGVAPADLYPLDFDRAFEKLNSIREHLILSATPSAQQQAIESGEADMAWIANARGLAAAENGAPVAPMMTDFVAYVVVASVPQKVKDLRASLAMINYAVGPEQQAKFEELTSYPATNLDAQPQLSAEQQEWVPTKEQLDEGGHIPDAQFYADNFAELMEKWQGWLTG